VQLHLYYLIICYRNYLYCIGKTRNAIDADTHIAVFPVIFYLLVLYTIVYSTIVGFHPGGSVGRTVHKEKINNYVHWEKQYTNTKHTQQKTKHTKQGNKHTMNK